MLKRIFFFVLTNIAVMVMFSIILFILSLFGININPQSMGGLLVFAAIFGFLGSFISLLMSKTLAVRSVGAQIIETPRNETEAWLLQTVQKLAMQWQLTAPQVAIYDSPEPNAFATGARKNASLIAVSTGLMNRMTRDEVEGVLGHEMAHIGNGDMVTMTLMQGVVNTFVIFFAQIVARIAAANVREELAGVVFFIANMALQIVFGLLASIVVMWFSRQREYRADQGAAKYVGAPKMIAALQRLKSAHGAENELPESINALGIAGGKDSLMSTHPSLDNRIARLQGLR
ncbi:MAG: protease HtpX [Neisseria sp.]|nr:protease HtpX [Neisseria sp.]